MTSNRWLSWEGCINVRDLGGLMTSNGRMTRWGAVVRSDHPAKLSAVGWSALYAHGVRTVISLRSDGQAEDVLDTAPRPSDLTSVNIAIEDLTDTDFVKQWVATDLWCTPLYYADALRRWPERHVRVIATVAHACPGGVLIHCGRGNDRTGIIILLLLALVGVSTEDIAADYELSKDPEREALLAREQTSVQNVIRATLAQYNIDSYLQAGGMSEADLASVRARLLDPTASSTQSTSIYS